jgi:hypothetical protein
MNEHNLKPCASCGNPVPWATQDTPKRYALKQYCSRGCTSRRSRRDYGAGMLRCSGCKEVQERELFGIDRHEPHGRSCYCQDCAAMRNQKSLEDGKIQAKDSVSYAVKQGVILAAREYPCVACGAQAQVHHHQSYEKSQRLNVVPLCRRCHTLLHRNDDPTVQSHFGVVVTRTGTIRIAIASSN